jgi:hypothetical protein
MARVQLFEGGNIQSQGTTGARMRAPDFGPDPLSTGLKAAGQAISAYAENQVAVEDTQDRASVKEAVNALGSHYAEVGFTGQNPYFESAGKDALSRRPEVEKGIDDFIAQSRTALGNDRQRKLFDETVVPQRTAWGVQIAEHAGKEAKQYDTDESQSRADVSQQLAVATYVQDPTHGEQQISTGLDEIDHVGALKGWGPDQLAEEKLKYTSGTYKDIGARLSYEGAHGPELAKALVEQHAGSMTADDREAVLTHARVAQNALEAEVRRQEADARRQAREDKSDARDRATSVLRMVTDGSVVEPEAMAKAIEDARTAEDPALEESLRQGGLKNGLTQEWVGATPAEIQTRVNELSAEITKKGGKVKPDVMVERDHLQTLLGSSRSALRQDPLAWGAEHLGLNITPLNLKDAGSISQRIQVATMIAKRTGTTPRPLTQDEVSATQQTLQHGTVQDKVGLTMRLAKLGPLALPAADQLTNDAGFHNLIGLATLQNSGVAASRVNQIITGYEVLKSKPKLIDNEQAQRQFNEMVGSSLQFLPQVRAGVMSNANALVAVQANETGASEWSALDSRGYFKAVNSALGAYVRDGKQVGGLATVNGAITVLPEDMTQEEFENRISKSHGPEFRKAQNGVPVYSDGRSPTATDLKRMQWVPSGDGVYRLSDGHGFLHTREGGFYEVDATRLNPSSFDAQLAAHGYVRR